MDIDLKKSLNNIGIKKGDFVLLCLGTMKSCFDSISPKLGTELIKRKVSFPVYGTIDEPYHRNNFESAVKKIKEEHPDKKILVYGQAASLYKNAINKLIFRNTPFCVGSGVGMYVGSVGDASILYGIDKEEMLKVTNLQHRNANIDKYIESYKNIVLRIADVFSKLDKQQIEASEIDEITEIRCLEV